MLTTQFLKKNGLKALDELHIRQTWSMDGRVILNYSQLDSPKHNPIVKECRGLTLDKDFNLVARSFTRFFNLGEHPESEKEFVWQDSIVTDKVDGSLVIFYYWGDRWNMNTRGTFGDQEVSPGLLWRTLFDWAKPNYDFDKRYTYVFELCSPYNQVVTYYSNPKLFLLTMFEGEDELPYSDLPVELAVQHSSFPNIEKLVEFANQQPGIFEGFVLRDINNRRIKVKNKKYLELHRIHNNGNIALPKNILPWVLDGEQAELLAYFPHLKESVRKIEKQIVTWKVELDNLWKRYYNAPTRKDFALGIKDHKLAAILFKSYPNGDWRQVFHQSKDFLEKFL